MDYIIQKQTISSAWVQYIDQQTILMMKSNHESSEGIIRLLEQDNKLVFAANTEEVFEFARTNHPDLFILDVNHLEINSIEMSFRLRTNSVSQRIPIIFIANSPEDVNLECIDADAIDYIQRPIRAAILKARVRTFLELKRYRDHQDGQITTDRLTGILNRHQLELLLNREWRRATRYQTPQSLIVMDIDFFKSFNNSYGHMVGDYCLQQIARVLIDNAKRETDSVARFGADEFAFLLPETDEGGAVQVAHRIQDTIEELAIPHNGSPIADHVTLSYGVATIRPRPSLKPASLLHQASEFLSIAKRDGHNQIRFGQGELIIKRLL